MMRTMRASMPRDYLKKIAHATFPLRVEDPYEVECVHVLRAADLVDATVTPASDHGRPEEVVVHRITPIGRAELDRMGRNP